MANEEKITIEEFRDNFRPWKELSKIDYFSLFLHLWIAFEIWLGFKYGKEKRIGQKISALKKNKIDDSIYDRLDALINGSNNFNIDFKNNFEQLHNILENYKIKTSPSNDEYISLLKIVKNEETANSIEITENFYLIDNIEKIYKEYIDVLHQLRNLIIHGNLANNDENMQLVKLLYLTFSDIIEAV